jgi:hypothetical protein
MQATFTTQKDGTTVLELDAEAARVTFASVVFAARFHDGVRRLESVARQWLDTVPATRGTGEQPCQ